MNDEHVVVLDACVLLNLVASGRPLPELGYAAGATFAVVHQAEREVSWLDGGDPDDARQAIDLEAVVAREELLRLTLADGELARFISLARQLGDGEAATLAVAEARALVVATDDRKARRILTTLNPSPAPTTTTALVRAWAAGRGDREVHDCLHAIQRRASFLPPRNDPDGAWWRDIVSQ